MIHTRGFKYQHMADIDGTLSITHIFQFHPQKDTCQLPWWSMGLGWQDVRYRSYKVWQWHVEILKKYPDFPQHFTNPPPLVGTWGSLILDITIASYSTTIFLILVLYFILQVKPRRDTSQGLLPCTKRWVTSKTAAPWDRRVPILERADTENYRS